MQGNGRDAAHLEDRAVVEQGVELRPVAAELGAEVEDAPERLLHGDDGAPDRQPPAEPGAQEGCRRQMVGMGMRLQHPVDAEAVALDMVDDRLGDRVEVRPAAASKSSTLSMIAPRPLAEQDRN